MSMKKVHFIVGTLGVIVFLLTGVYMHFEFDHLKGMEDGARMLLRSSHIYILLSAVINLSFGLYLVQVEKGFRRYVQNVISIIVIIAPLLLLTGFYLEHNMTGLQREYTRWGIYGLFLVGILLMVLKINEKKNTT